MKLRKIDMEDIENELASDSNDQLYMFSVFTLFYVGEIFGSLYGQYQTLPSYSRLSPDYEIFFPDDKKVTKSNFYRQKFYINFDDCKRIKNQISPKKSMTNVCPKA